jgi:TatD DNase family protein
VPPSKLALRIERHRTMYVDSHAHLDAAVFDADRDAVIARAQNAGLRYLLLIADLAKPESVQRVRELSERYQGIYWAAGIDPHQSSQARAEHFEGLKAGAQHPKFVAIGEIGLDYFYDYPRDAQARIFVRQLALARELRRPIIVHCRDAWSDLRRILRQYLEPGSADAEVTVAGSGAGPAARQGGAGILHCFTGSLEDALDLIKIGFYVSFAGNLTYRRSEGLRATARLLHRDRLLAETDSPYLAPLPHRSRRNEPVFVRETTRQLAALHGCSEEVMGRQLVENFATLFGLPP